MCIRCNARERDREREEGLECHAQHAIFLRCTRGSGGEVARGESRFAEQRYVRWEISVVTSIYKSL